MPDKESAQEAAVETATPDLEQRITQLEQTVIALGGTLPE